MEEVGTSAEALWEVPNVSPPPGIPPQAPTYGPGRSTQHAARSARHARRGRLGRGHETLGGQALERQAAASRIRPQWQTCAAPALPRTTAVQHCSCCFTRTHLCGEGD